MEYVTQIKNLIYEIRGLKVMLDSDLAELYEVETKQLNRTVKRNIERFPSDFMFQLTASEFETLRCQIGTSKQDEEKRGGRQYLPYVFTEQGVAMLSGILRSKRAIEVNIRIMRTFVELRQWALENKDISKRLTQLERYFAEHCRDNEKDASKVYEAIDLLMERTKPRKIGFISED